MKAKRPTAANVRVRKIPTTANFIAARNGVPCSLDKVECRARGFYFRGSVLFPLPLPPSDPKVFRSKAVVESAIERTQRLSRKIRGSIIRDFILAQFPTLQPFAVEAAFTVEPYKKA